MALRHRSRHLHATIYNKVVGDLTDLGWVTPPVNFGTAPVTVVDYQPEERQEAIRANTVAVSIGDVADDEDMELGAQVGGVRSALYPVFIDVYAAELALTYALCDDLRESFDCAIFPLVNQITRAATDQQIEIEQVIGVDKPAAANSADPFKRYWRVLRLAARLYYQT